MFIKQEQNILDLVPAIKRARNSYLYTYSGERLLDLYLDGGRALLGHRPPRFLVNIKNIMERGIYARYPNLEQERLAKMLELLLANHDSKYHYYSLVPSRQSVEQFYAPQSWQDPLDSKQTKPDLALWRPGLPNLSGRVLWLQIPVTSLSTVEVLVSSEPEMLPSSAAISPVIIHALIRALAALINTRLEVEQSRALIFDKLPIWKRHNFYLLSTLDQENYQKLFKFLLEHRFLIAPQHNIPSIIPWEVDSGELQRLAQLISKFIIEQ